MLEQVLEAAINSMVQGVLFANWNYFPRSLPGTLEKLGFGYEWSDEWDICECGKAFRTQPDCHFWEPAYLMDDSGLIYCQECKP